MGADSTNLGYLCLFVLSIGYLNSRSPRGGGSCLPARRTQPPAGEPLSHRTRQSHDQKIALTRTQQIHLEHALYLRHHRNQD